MATTHRNMFFPKRLKKNEEKRENALFREMKKDKCLRWYNVCHSKINPKERFWLVIFTRPTESMFEREYESDFWIWDSEENRAVSKNKLHLPEPDGDSFTTFSSTFLIESYIKEADEKVIFLPRGKGGKTYYIHNFDGKFFKKTDNPRKI